MGVDLSLDKIFLRPHPHNLHQSSIFSLKMLQMFSVHTMPEYFDHATVSSHFGFVFEETLGREITSSSCMLYNNHVKDTQGHG